MGNSTVFRSDFELVKGDAKEELQKAIEGNAYTISTYWEDTEEWKESNAKMEEKKRELSRRIELSFGVCGIEGN